MSTISAAKVEALAKKGHAKCHGRGVLGYRPGTHAAVLCTCVFRNLRRQGVNIYDQAAVAKVLAPDPPAGKEAWLWRARQPSRKAEARIRAGDPP